MPASGCRHPWHEHILVSCVVTLSCPSLRYLVLRVSKSLFQREGLILPQSIACILQYSQSHRTSLLTCLNAVLLGYIFLDEVQQTRETSLQITLDFKLSLWQLFLARLTLTKCLLFL